MYGHDVVAIFNTGSVCSFICTAMIHLFEGSTINREIRNFKAFDGHIIKTIDSIIVDLEYRGKK